MVTKWESENDLKSIIENLLAEYLYGVSAIYGEDRLKKNSYIQKVKTVGTYEVLIIMAKQPPNTEPPAEVDFAIKRCFDASKVFYDKHCVEQSLYFGINCTQDTVNKVYYFSVDYLDLSTNVDQYWR